jgi:transposase InsO family protein
VTRCLSFTTLERWYYAYKKRGLPGLMPRLRKDKGRAQTLPAPQRQLLCDIRREHPSASASLILRTLVIDGRLDKGSVSATTVRRLFAEQGLDRVGLRDGVGAHTRLRWEAERPGALWHGDVCHGPSLTIEGKVRPLRIHGMLDDASRFVVALEAHHQEREVDMLGLLVRALRRHGPPGTLYLDNGSTYRGETLAVGCARLGITLLHARPYDAPARGKMERFWRTLREGCLDHLGTVASLHDVNVRLWAFLDAHYHKASHASLLGRSPGQVFQVVRNKPDRLDEAKLREALTTRVQKRVRKDTTVTSHGKVYELDQGHLAGRLVTLCRCLVDLGETPWIEAEGRRFELRLVDAVRNSHRQRLPKKQAAPSSGQHPPFDPAGALLDKATGKSPRRGDR